MCVACNDLCIWNLDIALERRLAAAQSNMERAMIGVSWQDHRTNKWIRSKIKLRDIIHVIKTRKWTWAGQVVYRQDNRYACPVTDWTPMDGSRPRGRPLKNWRDEIDALWSWKTMLRPSSNISMLPSVLWSEFLASRKITEKRRT